MGKVIFLNQKSKEYHEERNIKINNPPHLRLVKNKPSKKLTLGQRIYQRIKEEIDS